MLKLKLQYFGHLMQTVDSLENDVGRDWGQEEKGMTEDGDGWMASPTWWAWVWVNSGSWWWTGRPGVLRLMRLQIVGHDWATELNWTKCSIVYIYLNDFYLAFICFLKYFWLSNRYKRSIREVILHTMEVYNLFIIFWLITKFNHAFIVYFNRKLCDNPTAHKKLTYYYSDS